MTAKLSFGVTYMDGHTAKETWEKADLYCPACGAHEVWIEDSPGDYYEGPEHLCAACGADFTMPRIGNGSSETHGQRLAAIRRFR